jgi:hypothetical protein
MPISPGVASNANTAANLFEVNRAVDAQETGKEVTLTKGANATMAAHSFELRAAEAGGVQH